MDGLLQCETVASRTSERSCMPLHEILHARWHLASELEHVVRHTRALVCGVGRHVIYLFVAVKIICVRTAKRAVRLM
jgi:hypothetical protein